MRWAITKFINFLFKGTEIMAILSDVNDSLASIDSSLTAVDSTLDIIAAKIAAGGPVTQAEFDLLAATSAALSDKTAALLVKANALAV